jgi:hypothetical protein
MATPDFGSDFSCTTDLTPTLAVVSGLDCLAEALVRRLGSRRGSLFYDPDYGTDLRQFLHGHASGYAMAQACESECSKSERVQSVRAVAKFVTENHVTIAYVAVFVKTAYGPFKMVLKVTDLTVEMIQFTKGAA